MSADQTRAGIAELNKRHELNSRNHIKASFFVHLNMHTERSFFDAKQAEVERQRGELKLPLGDGGIYQGSHVKPDLVVERLAREGIKVSIKAIPADRDAFCRYVAEVCAAYKDPVKYPEPDFTSIPGVPAMREAMADAERSLLIIRGGVKTGMDHDAFARALCLEPGLKMCASGTYKDALEVWDDTAKRWKIYRDETAVFGLITDVLKLTFKSFELGPVMRKTAHFDYQPIELPSNPIFGDNGFKSNVKRALMSRLPPQPCLNAPERNRHLLHFKCGVTLDLSPGKAYDDQKRVGLLEDRNSRCTGWDFKEFGDEAARSKMRQACALLDMLWRQLKTLTVFSEGAEERGADESVRTTALHALRLLKELMPCCPLLRALATSHGSREEPGFDEALYELCQFTRGATGARGYDELLMYFGPTGANRKSTTFSIILAAFGSSINKDFQGYCTVQKAGYFQQKSSKEPSVPDEGIAALVGAKFVLVDEFKKKVMEFNEEIVKVWSDSGTVLPYEKKFGSREEVEQTWLMAWFLNELPMFRDAGAPFFRRLSTLLMLMQFKNPDEYDERIHTHRLADTSIRVGAVGFRQELICWVRLFSKAFHERSGQSTVLLPRPRSVANATAQMAGAGGEDVPEGNVRASSSTDGPLPPVIAWAQRRLEPAGRGMPSQASAVKAAMASELGVGHFEFSQKLADIGMECRSVKR